MCGLEGDDVLVGLGGDDLICAGPGNDIVFVGEGSNIVQGGQGDDSLSIPHPMRLSWSMSTDLRTIEVPSWRPTTGMSCC